MSSDKLHSQLVDLLYDDELEPDERDALRAELAEAPDARAELEGFESLLGRIRDAEPLEEVPGSVHDSIMGAARQHAADRTAKKVEVAHRQPPSEPREQGLWTRLRQSGASQLIAAAGLVLAAGLLFYVFQLADREQMSGAPASQQVQDEVAFGGVAEEATAEAEPAANEADEAGSAAAAPVEEQDEALAQYEPEAAAPEREPLDKGGPAEGAAEKPSSTDDGKLAMLDKKRDETRQRSRRRSRKRPAPQPRQRRATNEKSFDSFDGFEANRAPSKKTAPSKDDAEVLGNRSQTRGGAEQPDQDRAEAGVSDVAELGQLARSSTDRPAAAAPTAGGAAPAAEPAEAKAQQQAPGGVAVADVEKRYNQGDDRGAIALADQYLAGSPDEPGEARVLEIKARALARLQRYRDALQVYVELMDAHPSYRSEQVRQARNRVERELESRRQPAAKRRKSKPADEAQIDLDDAPAEAAEPAPQPSSIESY